MTVLRSWCWAGALALLLAAMPVLAFGPPRDLEDYVVLGIADVRMRDGAFVAAGHVGVNDARGDLELNRRIFLGVGSAAVANTARLGRGTSIADLFANEVSEVTGSLIRGAGPTAFVPPIIGLPPLPTFAPGTTNVTVPRAGTLSLGHGKYGVVVVPDDARLELLGGTYDLADLRVGKSAKVLIDAPSTLNIQGILDVGRFTGFGPASSALSARDVVVNVGGPFVGFGAAAHVSIDLLAPNARVRFGRSSRGRGRFIGERIQIGRTTNFRAPTCAGPGSAGCEDRSPPQSNFCTLTQATYGSAAGAANGPTGLVTQHPQVLPLTIGAPGIRGLTVPSKAGLVCFLPAAGDPAVLCSQGGCDGDTTVSACANPPLVDFVPAGDGSSGGQEGGAFTGETIAAKLNVALSRLGATPHGLGNLVLPETLCTTKCPTGREIDPITMKNQASAAGIADGFTTLDDLLALADQALSQPCRIGTCDRTDRNAFAPPDPIRLSSIETALRAVNECFEGCATIVPCP